MSNQDTQARARDLIARGPDAFKSSQDYDIAQDMLRRGARFGLSEKQWAFLYVIVSRASGTSTRAPRAAVPRTVDPITSPKFPRVLALFVSAMRNGLAKPRVRFMTGAGLHIALAPSSKYPNSIRVLDAKATDDSRRFHGWIDAQGFHVARGCDSSTASDIVTTLRNVELDPVAAAKLYGRQTSSCCMCGRHLDTSESVTAGYGPICADKYGLPWGHVSRDAMDAGKKAALADALATKPDGAGAYVHPVDAALAEVDARFDGAPVPSPDDYGADRE